MKKLFLLIGLAVLLAPIFELNANESLRGKNIVCKKIVKYEVFMSMYFFIDEENVEIFYNTKERAIESETWAYKVDDHKVYLVDPDDNYEVGIIIDRYDLFISFINNSISKYYKVHKVGECRRGRRGGDNKNLFKSLYEEEFQKHNNSKKI